MRNLGFFSAVLAILAGACFRTDGGDAALLPDGGVSPMDDATDASSAGGGDSQGGGGDTGGGCLTSEVTLEIASNRIDKLDLLFVVDNSGSMREEQEALREQFPRLLRQLTTGDLDGDGVADLPAARDLHLGVVSSDMGAVQVDGITGCQGLGDDGVMNTTPDPSLAGCAESYPRFLTYARDVTDPDQTATHLACLASLGTDGCTFEQPLEAALKALWPSVDVDPITGQPLQPNRIQFLGDANGFGQLGHGDTENAGFLRSDPIEGLSVIAVVVVSDEEDCSSRDTHHFTPAVYLDANDPLVQQDPDLRCFYNPQNLYDLERYVNGLRALRPGNEHLVVFGAIVGVPADLLADADDVDFGDPRQSASFYDQILSDPRMQEAVDPDLPMGMRNLLPSCITEQGRAYPPRRYVELARRFGESGFLGSICQPDLGAPIEQLVERAASRLAAPCLPRPLARQETGLTGCRLLWRLPPPNLAPVGTPVDCDGLDFLDTPSSGDLVDDRGGRICEVRQLSGSDGEAGADEGWYLDDFSASVLAECPGATPQRIAYTAGAEPPFGVSVRLHCTQQIGDADACEATPSNGSDNGSSDTVGRACLPESVPEGGFDDREAYVEVGNPQCDGSPCLVYRLRGDPRNSCDPASQTCADPEELIDRVYCSCRCNPPDGEGCACPSGFSCVDVLDAGPESIRGGYCVRNGTFSR